MLLFLCGAIEFNFLCFAMVGDNPSGKIDGVKAIKIESNSHLIRKEKKPQDMVPIKVNQQNSEVLHQNKQIEFRSSQSRTLYDTVAYLDEYHAIIQSIPGAVNFAFYDVGGEGKAYHSNSEENFGSCGLNPCDIVEIRNVLQNDPHDVNGDGVNFDEEDVLFLYYLNSLRSKESASVSYTKWAVGDWAGDRHAGDDTQMTPYIPYWGWLPMGEWVRVTFDVKENGLYHAALTATCNSGGYISIRIDKAIQMRNYMNADSKVNKSPSLVSDPLSGEINEQMIETTETSEDETESEMFINEVIGSTVDEAPVFSESHIRIPPSGHYHQWQVYDRILENVEFPSTGLYIITVTVESFDSYPDGQFGNIMKLDFSQAM